MEQCVPFLTDTASDSENKREQKPYELKNVFGVRAFLTVSCHSTSLSQSVLEI